jgi:hypothetical protein
MYFSSKIRGNIAVGHEFAPENMGIQAEQNAIQLTFGLYINIYCNSVCKYIYMNIYSVLVVQNHQSDILVPGSTQDINQ